MPEKISVSIVVHQQAALAFNFLKDLNSLCDTQLEALVTVNVPETIPFAENSFKFPVSIIRNRKPKGFGANHNAAFKRKQSDYFCIANPDIRFEKNPLPILMRALDNHKAAIAAPAILNELGHHEDNVRHFPTPASIIAKLVGIWPLLEYPQSQCAQPFSVEWTAGMFLLFKSHLFAEVGGFDEKYHLYYEDVDICARLALAGYKIMACPSASVIHSARRESHRNLRYMRWHLKSMLRFFCSPTYRQVRALRSH
jgi:GT2 family glycosyltransferase